MAMHALVQLSKYSQTKTVSGTSDGQHNDGSVAIASLGIIVAESEAMRRQALPQESHVFGCKLNKMRRTNYILNFDCWCNEVLLHVYDLQAKGVKQTVMQD